MKIVHLSDTHIGQRLQDGQAPTEEANFLRWQQILQHFNQQEDLDLKDCILIHTGDLIHTSNQQQRDTGLIALDAAKALFQKVYLVPGNHDCGNSARISASAHQAFLKDFSSYLFAGGPASFPSVHLLDDNFALIGIDSNAEEKCLFDSLFAEGEIGEKQLAGLQTLLDSEQLKSRKLIFMLHHHPFPFPVTRKNLLKFGENYFQPKVWKVLLIKLTMPFRRLKDASHFLKIIEDRAELLLFGHKHEGIDCSFRSKDFGIKCALDASSSTQTDNFLAENGKPAPMRIRIIDLETMQIQQELIPFELKEE